MWWARQDLNLGPTDYESAALTAELRARFAYIILQRKDLVRSNDLLFLLLGGPGASFHPLTATELKPQTQEILR